MREKIIVSRGRGEMQGWISLYRKIKNNIVWTDPNYLKLWIHCLLEASHKEREQLVGNQIVNLKKGEFVTGRFSLTEQMNKGVNLNIDLMNERGGRHLQNLEKWQMLTIKSTNKFSIVTIENYEIYQSGLGEFDQETDQELTNSCPSIDHQLTTNNNVNNYNNLLLLSISKADFPNFYDWLEEKNIEVDLNNEEAYYLKYLHERSNHYYKTKGKEHPDTVDAIKAFEERKSLSSQEIVLKAQSI